jgi:hypothetical protein
LEVVLAEPLERDAGWISCGVGVKAEEDGAAATTSPRATAAYI